LWQGASRSGRARGRRDERSLGPAFPQHRVGWILLDLPAERIGTRSFALLKVAAAEAVPGEEVRALCGTLRDSFAA